MSLSPNNSTVHKFYQDVIEDVLRCASEDFAKEGVDEETIQELKQIWEAKLLGNVCRAPIRHDPHKDLEDKMVSVQIVLSDSHPQGNGKKVVIVQVPASAVQNRQIYNVLIGPVISATMSLSQPLAAAVLQQHMDAAFKGRQQAQKSITDMKTHRQSDVILGNEPMPSTSGLNEIKNETFANLGGLEKSEGNEDNGCDGITKWFKKE